MTYPINYDYRSVAAKGVADALTRFFDNLLQNAKEILGINKPKRVIDEERSQEVMEKYLPYFQENAVQATDRLVTGEITPKQWGALIHKQLVTLYIGAASAGVGHVGRLMPEALDDIDKVLKQQDKYLNKFVEQLENTPKENFNPEKILYRIMLYPGSAISLVEKNLYRSQGKPELPFYPKQGTLCFHNCKCKWDWKEVDKEKGDWDVVWSMDNEFEHCSICLERATACNPLEIRGSKIVTDLDMKKLVHD